MFLPAELALSRDKVSFGKGEEVKLRMNARNAWSHLWLLCDISRCSGCPEGQRVVLDRGFCSYSPVFKMGDDVYSKVLLVCDGKVECLEAFLH